MQRVILVSGLRWWITSSYNLEMLKFLSDQPKRDWLIYEILHLDFAAMNNVVYFQVMSPWCKGNAWIHINWNFWITHQLNPENFLILKTARDNEKKIIFSEISIKIYTKSTLARSWWKLLVDQCFSSKNIVL